MGRGVPPPEINADLPDFTPECVHLLLREVYGDFPHHNDGLHMDREVADDTIWQRRWRRIATQLASWYATTSVAVGRPSWPSWQRNGGRFSLGVGNPRNPLSSPTSFLQRRWSSVGQRRSVQGYPGGWTSKRGVSMQAWWGVQTRKDPPRKKGPPAIGKRRRRMRPW